MSALAGGGPVVAEQGRQHCALLYPVTSGYQHATGSQALEHCPSRGQRTCLKQATRTSRRQAAGAFTKALADAREPLPGQFMGRAFLAPALAGELLGVAAHTRLQAHHPQHGLFEDLRIETRLVCGQRLHSPCTAA
ncbi:hypothetical protein D3C79_856750 [compost metagenome]